jgi:hypothetical protein
MAPEVGLEPTTLRLTAECSAIELLRSVYGRAGTLFPLTVIAKDEGSVKAQQLIYRQRFIWPEMRTFGTCEFSEADFTY